MEYQSEVDTARFLWHFVPLFFCETHHQGVDIQRKCVWSVLEAHSLAVGLIVIFCSHCQGYEGLIAEMRGLQSTNTLLLYLEGQDVRI